MKKFRTIESRNDFLNRRAGKTAIKGTPVVSRAKLFFSPRPSRLNDLGFGLRPHTSWQSDSAAMDSMVFLHSSWVPLCELMGIIFILARSKSDPQSLTTNLTIHRRATSQFPLWRQQWTVHTCTLCIRRKDFLRLCIHHKCLLRLSSPSINNTRCIFPFRTSLWQSYLGTSLI